MYFPLCHACYSAPVFLHSLLEHSAPHYMTQLAQLTGAWFALQQNAVDGLLCSRTDCQEGRVSTGRSVVIPSACYVALLESRRLQRRSAHGICNASALLGFFQASFQRTIPVGSEESLLPRDPILECQRSVFPSPVKVSRTLNVTICFASGSSCLLLCSIET